MSEKKVDGKKSLRDFGIGVAAGAGSAVVGYPFDRIADPISSQGYHKAMSGRPFPTYLKENLKKLIHAKEWSALPIKMLKSGVVLGTGTLIAGGLYRAFKDKQPVEKQAAYNPSVATQVIGQMFISCKSKKS